MSRLPLVLGFLLLPLPLAAQQPFDFSIANIMRGPELYGRAPESVRWSSDGRWIYFSWVSAGTDWRDPMHPYRVRATPGAQPERLTDAQMDSAGPLLAAGDLSRDRRHRVVSYDGDLYLVDTRTSAARRLTRTVEREESPSFDAAGTRVFFVRGDNVFALELADGAVRQLTDIRGPAPAAPGALSPQRQYVEARQKELFESVRDAYRADSIGRADSVRRAAGEPGTLYLLKDEHVAQLAVSPTGTALLLVTRKRPDNGRPTEIPTWVTKSGYVEHLTGRENVGDEQATGRVAFVSLPSGRARWLRIIPDDSAASTSPVRVLGWDESGSAALVWGVRSNWKARYLATVGADSGRVHIVDTLRDSAWVDGPCFGCGGWYDHGRRIWFVSEADGWAHLYTMNADGGDRVQRTRGAWEVLDASLSSDERWFYIHSGEPSHFERQFYRMSTAGGPMERLTSAPGGHDVTVSPDGRMLADVYSYANKPPELYLAAATRGAPMAQLTVSTTAEFRSFPWIVPKIIMIPASDGVQVPARIYRPADMGATANGAAVIFVHGAGYLHNVHDYWSEYPREYLFNQFLATKGYVVLDVDYRGSAGYGRDWRTAIYRHMGGRDLQDEVDASRWLTSSLGIAPARIGIYGGSYGGFMTLMALFTEGSHFGAGAALRSVTDWAHYNHGYTSRILNEPQSDSVAYRQSSPIYFAQGLDRPLLMAHGMVDTNVEFQDIVRLTQRLIELGKTDWQLAVYPVESHGFVRPSSWTDEYRRIVALFERTLRQ